jgi:hypothetical protein
MKNSNKIGKKNKNKNKNKNKKRMVVSIVGALLSGSKLHVRETDYKLLQSQKADTTTFVVSKKRTLQTFLVDGLCIVVFCIPSIS